jgi:ATP-dependent helicase/DNAse subunit B
LGIDINIEENTSIVVHKGEKEMAEILKYADENEKPRLSPTRLFKYVKCPLMFYFDSIAKLSHSDELTDKMDALTIGSILHKSIETLYKEHNIVGMLNPQASIEKLRNKEVVEPVVDAVIGEKFYNNPKATTEDFTGDTLLVRDVIIKYIIDGIMYYDSKHDGYIIKELEHSINYRYTTSQGHQVKLYGEADRIDKLSNGMRQIIDYKSGHETHLEFAGIDSLFNGKDEKRISNVFQTLLYAMIVHYEKKTKTVPSLFYASKMLKNDKYSPFLKNMGLKPASEITDYDMVKNEFEPRLKALLDELFDPTKPFVQAEDKSACSYCDYKTICKR